MVKKQFVFNVVHDQSSNMVQVFKSKVPSLIVPNAAAQAFFREHGVETKVSRSGATHIVCQDPLRRDERWDLAYIKTPKSTVVDFEKKYTAALRKAFTFNTLEPRAHQAALAKHFASHDWREDALERPHIFNWHTGAGKTFGTLHATLGSRTPPKYVTIVCSNTLIDQWKNAVMQQPLGGGPTASAHVKIIGYTAFKTNPHFGVDDTDVLIFDEAHEWRNRTKDQAFSVQVMRKAPNVLLTSATLLVNSDRDLLGLLELMGEDITHHKGKGDEVIMWGGEVVDGWDVKRIKSVFDGNVSFYDPAVHARDDYAEMYPRVKHDTINVEMSVPQAFLYLISCGKFVLSPPDGGKCITLWAASRNSYRSGEQQACNDPDVATGMCHKGIAIERALTAGDDVYPCVIHSMNLEKGLYACNTQLMRNPKLKALGRQFVTGATKESQRQKIFDDFNKGKIDILNISKAASQGTSLLGTSRMFLMDVHQNMQTQRQTEGRVVRMDSHPRGHDSTVQITQLVSVFPKALLGKTVNVAKLSLRDKTCLEELMEEYGLSDRMTLAQVVETMRATIDALLGGKTVNQSMLERNLEKQRKVDQILQVLQTCSIPMPRGAMVVGGAAKRKKAPSAGPREIKPKARAQTVKTHCKALWKAWQPKELKPVTFSSCVTKAIEKMLAGDEAMLGTQPKKLVANTTFQRLLRDEALLQAHAMMAKQKDKKSKMQQRAFKKQRLVESIV